MQGAGRLQARVPIGGHVHAEALAREVQPQQVGDGALVLDDERLRNYLCWYVFED